MRLSLLSALVALTTLAIKANADVHTSKLLSLNARHLLRAREEAETIDYDRFKTPQDARHSVIFGGDENVKKELDGGTKPSKTLLSTQDEPTPTDNQPASKPKGKLPPMATLPSKIFGVNLGAWFVLENWQGNSIFLTPDLVDQTLTDEYHWSQAVGKEEGAKRLKAWYDSRYTEDDFAQMKKAGLNMVRIPVSHWMLNASNTEPYIGGIQMPFLKRGLKWAQKYNLSVMIDIHTSPGSQNGYDNSGYGSNGALGKSSIEWPKNSTNFLRSLSALKTLTEEVVNTKEFGGIVKAIEVMNEPHTGKDAIPISLLALFFKESYDLIRDTVNSSAPVTPYVVFNLFQSPVDNSEEMGGLAWDGESGWNTFFLSDAFKNGTFFLDSHQYQAWDGLLSLDEHIARSCNKTASLEAQMAKVPVLIGEYSLGITVRCVSPTVPSYHSCKGLTIKDDLKTLSAPPQVLFAKRFYEAQRVAYGKTMGMMMWNWKTDSAAAWSYQASLDAGWIPKNPTDVRFKVLPAGSPPLFQCVAHDDLTTKTIVEDQSDMKGLYVDDPRDKQIEATLAPALQAALAEGTLPPNIQAMGKEYSNEIGRLLRAPLPHLESGKEIVYTAPDPAPARRSLVVKDEAGLVRRRVATSA